MFKKLTDDAKLPQRATKFSAGFDVYANENVAIGAGETKLIKLGIAIDLENWLNDYFSDDVFDSDEAFKKQYFFELHIRSSLRVKGLTSLGTGVVDIDYPDEIKMVIHNPLTHSNMAVNEWGYSESYTINKGDKIGQLILKRHEGYLLPSEYTLDNERVGGFGSTNTKDNQ